MKKVLIITQIYPSGFTGTSVKTRNMVDSLLESGFAVDMICLRFADLAESEIIHSNFRLFAFTREKKSKWRIGIIGKFFNYLFSIKPIRVNQIYDHRIIELEKLLQKSNNYCQILFDGFTTLQYISRETKNAIYVEDEDIGNLYLKRAKYSQNFFKRWFYFFESCRCQIYEKKSLKKINQIWAISDITQQRFSKNKSLVIPTIIDLKPSVFNPNSRDIVFTGTLDWPENVTGIEWFIRQCWPIIKKNCPKTSLFIVGQNPQDRLKKMSLADRRIKLLGFVPDLGKIYRKCAVGIAPIFLNCGIKIKILTYLSYGIPVISFDNSVSGLKSKNGIISATEKGFSSRLISLLNDVDSRKKMSKKAIENIKANYSVDFFKSVIKKWEK